MIRYGIMLPSDFKIADWQLNCLERIHEKNEAKLSLLLINETGAGRRFKVKNLLFKIYRKLFFTSKSIKKRDINVFMDVSDVPTISCEVNRKGFSEYFHNDDIEEIKSHDLDFILRFSFGIIRGEILSACKYGIWSYHHGDELKYRGTPPGFWEIYEDQTSTGVILQRLTNKLDGGVILKKGFYKTIDHSYSKHLDNLYYNSADLVSLVCKELGLVDEDFFTKISKTNAPIKYEPNNEEFIRFALKLIQRKIKKFYNLLTFENWNVGILEMTFEEVVESGIDANSISWVKGMGKSEFIADPFQSHKDEHSFFAEYYHYKESKGKIVEITLRQDKGTKEIATFLETKSHLSYPYTYKEKGIKYLFPETSENGRQDLIEYNNDGILRTRAIIEGPLVDSTILKHRDKYWLFCTLKNDMPDTKLFLYYAEDLDKKWNYHPKNPIKIDVRSSRPGGDFFQVGDDWFRSAQNCSVRYGGSISICKIKELTEFNYEEEVVKEIPPIPPYKKGIHTLSSFENRLLVDGKKEKFIWLAFLNAVKRRLKML